MAPGKELDQPIVGGIHSEVGRVAEQDPSSRLVDDGIVSASWAGPGCACVAGVWRCCTESPHRREFGLRVVLTHNETVSDKRSGRCTGACQRKHRLRLVHWWPRRGWRGRLSVE
jgi:hypothetical protein